MSACLAWIRRNSDWTGCFVLLGLALRLYHYGRNPSVWHDEAALVMNVLTKDFAQLLGPLDTVQAAPPLFLWLVKLATLAFGDSSYALRLVPFLSSCAALVVLAWVARQVLLPAAVRWAVLLFAVSDHLLWHACETKPYSSDVLAAVIVAGLVCLRRAEFSWRHLFAFAGVAPILIALAYPACFLCGGLLTALIPSVWRARRLSVWMAYGILVVAVAGTFLLLLIGPIHAQKQEALDSYWQDFFPAWDRAWTVPLWFARSTTEILRYCCEPVGNVLTGLLIVGAISLWRRGGRAFLAVLLVPLTLALLAGCVKAYPYSGTRLLVFMSPAVILLLAEGVPPTIAWLRPRLRFGAGILFVLLMIPVGEAAFRLFHQSGRSDCAGASEYVLSHRSPSEFVACNAGEGQYYFRHLGAAYGAVEHARAATMDSFWLITISSDPSERRQILVALTAEDWQVQQQREFERISVVHLTRLCRQIDADPASSRP